MANGQLTDDQRNQLAALLGGQQSIGQQGPLPADAGILRKVLFALGSGASRFGQTDSSPGLIKALSPGGGAQSPLNQALKIIQLQQAQNTLQRGGQSSAILQQLLNQAGVVPSVGQTTQQQVIPQGQQQAPGQAAAQAIQQGLTAPAAQPQIQNTQAQGVQTNFLSPQQLQQQNLLQAQQPTQPIQGQNVGGQQVFAAAPVDQSQPGGFDITSVTATPTSTSVTGAPKGEVARKENEKKRAEAAFNSITTSEAAKPFLGAFQLALAELKSESGEEVDSATLLGAGLRTFSKLKSAFNLLPETKAFVDQIQAFATPLAKAAGEDRLTNEDIQRFTKLVPDVLSDSTPTNVKKIRNFVLTLQFRSGTNIETQNRIRNNFVDAFRAAGGPLGEAADQIESFESDIVEAGKSISGQQGVAKIPNNMFASALKKARAK